MKTIYLYPSRTELSERGHLSAKEMTLSPRITGALIAVACSLAASMAGVALAAWAVSQGSTNVLGAMLFASGFVFLAVAVDRPEKKFLLSLLSGLGVIGMTLLGHFLAPEFHMLAATIPGIALGEAIWTGRSGTADRV